MKNNIAAASGLHVLCHQTSIMYRYCLGVPQFNLINVGFDHPVISSNSVYDSEKSLN